MEKASSHLYQTLPSSKHAHGYPGTLVLSHLLSLFWDVPQMVFYISWSKYLMFFCSSPWSWSLPIPVSALCVHTLECHSSHSSLGHICQGTREQDRIPCSPLLGCTLLSGLWSSVTHSLQLIKVPCENRLFCLCVWVSQQSQRLDQEPISCHSLLPSLSLFFYFFNNTNANHV